VQEPIYITIQGLPELKVWDELTISHKLYVVTAVSGCAYSVIPFESAYPPKPLSPSKYRCSECKQQCSECYDLYRYGNTYYTSTWCENCNKPTEVEEIE